MKALDMNNIPIEVGDKIRKHSLINDKNSPYEEGVVTFIGPMYSGGNDMVWAGPGGSHHPQACIVIKKAKKEIVFWGSDDADYLTHTDIDCAIEEEINRYDPNDPIPEEIKVFGYARAEIKIKDELTDKIQEMCLEVLDENYGGEEPITTSFSKEVVEKIKEATEAICNEYTPWVCDPIETRTINTKEWLSNS